MKNVDQQHHTPEQVLGIATDMARSFRPAFLDCATCREWLISRLHNRYQCPRCAAQVPLPAIGRYMRGERIRCADCRRQFTAWTGTWMSGAKMDPREIVAVALLAGLGLPTAYIAQATGRSANTIGEWRRILTP